MRSDLKSAENGAGFKVYFPCRRDCEDEAAHNRNAEQLAEACRERYVQAARRRLARYAETGEIGC
jgi:hypothetical protein